MVLMNAPVERALRSHSGKGFADSLGGTVIEDEWSFRARFADLAKTAPKASPKRIALYDQWGVEGSSVKGLRWWRRKLDRGEWLFGDRLVAPVLDAPLMVWRLAESWESGISWAADAGRCSVPSASNRQCALTLYCALVDPADVMGVWWRGGSLHGYPMWRTVEHPEHGRIVVAVQDFSEVLVSPVRLRQTDMLSVGSVTAVETFEDARVDRQSMVLASAMSMMLGR